ncbi:hypothetical protein K2173_003287 [Erythroxylum novogranatense]|uniref:CG-1 domain-containing protein n=1 Tax=Erythroxylum novogranatense TaxID=1862640 RepID=A0AAV8SY45_9ROSI|nr:hypothetical protein K2173_003287 [Erythroxylum novogranatense]
MSESGDDTDKLFQEAQARWLKPPEILSILQNQGKYQLTQEPVHKPSSGSVFLFNKKVTRFFRRDGHNWRKKKDGRTVGEAHERLKVGNVEALNCYYAHGEQNPNFQRRSYWMLDPAHEHIVLVHYREITEGKLSPASTAESSPASSSTLVPSTSPYTPENQGFTSAVSDRLELHQKLYSPGYAEVSSERVIKDDGVDYTVELASYPRTEVSQFLRKLEEQLSLNDESIKDIDTLNSQQGAINNSELLKHGREMSKQYQSVTSQDKPGYIVGNQSCGMQLQANNMEFLQDGGSCDAYQQSYSCDYKDGNKESLSWNEMLESCNTLSPIDFQEKPHSTLSNELTGEEQTCWQNFNGNDVGNSSTSISQELESVKMSTYSLSPEIHDISSDYLGMLYEHTQLPIEVGSRLTLAQQQKFIIHEISPEWGYPTEATKVIIVGSFLCDPSESALACMFGDTEVPLQIVQEGVILCEAPPHLPGKVSLCITAGNREACSEIREFEYRAKATSCCHCNESPVEATKSPDELLLLVRFVQLLLSDSLVQKGESMETGIHLLRKLKANDESWGHVIEALLFGIGTSSSTIDWLMQQLVKDKLCQWLSSRSKEKLDDSGCSLSKKEQGIIHMVAGLGFEWALSPILSKGVSIDFRDINGWTALHWAARFGRENMVAALLASGASAGAVTDPNPQDPVGKTPAFIAATSGHKGLAGYLSEVALTSHLSSLRLEETELSKGSAEVQAEGTVNSISTMSLAAGEDQVSMKQTLAAVRNAAQAAARIQSAFRAHSFRKRQHRESNSAISTDEYGIVYGDIPGLSMATKMAFGSARDYNSAALSIQKKYRGWKGRKDFLALRQKVVTIQAHVRGYRVRKQYKVICWAVGIMDKAVLRWRRKGVGLRGFRNETEHVDESSEDEDILKVFRKQKVDGAIEEAVHRVLNMVDSPEARQQYHRMLERCYQAKLLQAELGDSSEAATLTYVDDVSDMDELFEFQ